MDFWEVLRNLLGLLSALIGLAFTLLIMFLISGLFNHFTWDIKYFAMKMSIPVAVVLGIAVLIWWYKSKRG
ncbi:hypothetical protein A8139_00810 [Marinomonas primoryensis]|uniref:Uncharacterized protein n=1 Tax=Marinomonas primoryensis TaxID=178399 RepID=A0A2Z4PNQ8_9GAMM|nr:hypothetical protein [Marinomonas primoryensis]AWX98693.1 hypothetical protein A8139_00810 [Marinomonas primoryensis]